MEVPLLVTDFLDRAVRIYPDKLAIVDGDRRYTYREFNERVDRLSNALLDLGLRQGDRVCMLSPNSHFYLESFYAAAQTGIILVPLNYRLVAADHQYILNHSGVPAVLVDWEYTAVVDDIRQECERSGRVVELKIPRQGEQDVGACFVRYAELADAARARESLHKRQFDGNTVTAIHVDSF